MDTFIAAVKQYLKEELKFTQSEIDEKILSDSEPAYDLTNLKNAIDRNHDEQVRAVGVPHQSNGTPQKECFARER